MELGSRFFESGAWLKPRRFSSPEAFIDLVGSYEAGIVEGDPENFFSLRWSWAPDEVRRFIHGLHKSRWWNPGRHRLGRPAIKQGIKQGPPAAQRALVESIHLAYNQEFGRRLKLTPNRKKAYARLLFAGLEKDKEPLERFRKLCKFVQTRDFYMSDLRLHAPESLFRNPERCESWLEESSGNATLSADHARERKRVEGFRRPVPSDAEVDVTSLFDSLSEEKQIQVRAEFDERKKRLVGLTRFRETMEQAVWSEIVTREAG